MRQRLSSTEEPRSIIQSGNHVSPSNLHLLEEKINRANADHEASIVSILSLIKTNYSPSPIRPFPAHSDSVFAKLLLWLSAQPMAGISTCRAAVINFPSKNRSSLISSAHHDNTTTHHDTAGLVYSSPAVISPDAQFSTSVLKERMQLFQCIEAGFIERDILHKSHSFKYIFAQVILSFKYLACVSPSFAQDTSAHGAGNILSYRHTIHSFKSIIGRLRDIH